MKSSPAIREFEALIGRIMADPSPVRTDRRLLGLMVVPILLIGIGTRDGDFEDPQNVIALGVIFGTLGMVALPFVLQSILIEADGIVIKKVFRKPERFLWDEIDSFYWNKWFRFVSIRSGGKRIYLNSTDALDGGGDLVIVLAIRTEFRCRERVSREIRKLIVDHVSVPPGD